MYLAIVMATEGSVALALGGLSCLVMFAQYIREPTEQAGVCQSHVGMSSHGLLLVLAVLDLLAESE